VNSPAALRFSANGGVIEAQRHIARVRFAECLQRQSVLDGGDDAALHAFRLACKRLRFALERMEQAPADLDRAIALCGRLTGELGGAHDCARLAELADGCNAPLVAVRARRDRDVYVRRAQRLWRRAFSSHGEFAPLARYAGFTWSVS
jgi:CHAD domain-containing protein